MADDRPLSSAFSAAASASLRRRLPAGPALERALQGVLRRARQEQPEVAVAGTDFVRHLAGRLEPGEDLLAALEALHAGDAYLACACARKEAAALSGFDRRFRRVVAEAVARMVNRDPDFVEDVRQALREKLFVGVRGTPPKILDYSGAGPLDSWLRSAAVRTALNLREGTRREEPMDDALADRLPESSDDPEIKALKDRCRRELKGAFQAALGQLSAQERDVLRLNLVEGQSIDRIAERFGTHRSTAARWLTQAKQRVTEFTRDELVARLDWNDRELRSVVRLVRSQLDLSIQRYL
ncbi:MAG TPA: sigma-70 family RNA polymerase sigma factor [Myxococcales bacterium]|nr:sigma-70 family RNA polymerase sigma factor [Myxococcales bacterium]